jgi:transposase
MRENNSIKPADYVISSFGSGSEVARVLGVDKSTVSRWKLPKERKGTNGNIPQKYWVALLSEAQTRSIRLTISDLAGL